MTTRSRIGSILAVVSLTALLAPVCPADDTVGGRLWYAQWEANGTEGSEDEGYAPMFVLQYSHQFANEPWLAFAQAGYGSGWSGDISDLSRMDLLAGAWGVYEWLQYGLAYRYLREEEDVNATATTRSWEWTGQYHGPELMLGGKIPLMEKFKLNLQATWQPVVFWSGDYSPVDDREYDGQTWAYSVDAGLSYHFTHGFVQAGYRLQHIEEDRVNDDRYGEMGITDDDFQGPYVGINYTW